ncbi:MAG: cytidine deaminase [Clostridiaceae bacterium]|jgi:cytidine deaminase|nr:cytidine deaminase [Clostridiaceae bacterium]
MEKNTLIEKAMEAKKNAYVPYSNFRVGAAVYTGNGKVYTGCNVENASYGAAICAERTAVVKAVSDGETALKAIAITSDSEDYTFPCGICRQVIAEFGNDETRVICSNKDGKYREYTLKDILPHAFTKKDLL